MNDLLIITIPGLYPDARLIGWWEQAYRSVHVMHPFPGAVVPGKVHIAWPMSAAEARAYREHAEQLATTMTPDTLRAAGAQEGAMPRAERDAIRQHVAGGDNAHERQREQLLQAQQLLLLASVQEEQVRSLHTLTAHYSTQTAHLQQLLADTELVTNEAASSEAVERKVETAPNLESVRYVPDAESALDLPIVKPDVPNKDTPKPDVPNDSVLIVKSKDKRERHNASAFVSPENSINQPFDTTDLDSLMPSWKLVLEHLAYFLPEKAALCTTQPEILAALKALSPAVPLSVYPQALLPLVDRHDLCVGQWRVPLWQLCGRTHKYANTRPHLLKERTCYGVWDVQKDDTNDNTV